MRSHLRIPLATLAGVIVLSGCPRPFNPTAAPAVKTENREAEQRFIVARQKFEAGGGEEADQAFSRFITHHPADPLAPLAQVYRGRIALAEGKLSQAREQLREPARRPAGDTVGMQARYYLGLVAVRQGSFTEGRGLLLPYLRMTAEEAQPPLLAALALAASRLKAPVEAANHLNRWHGLTRQPAEKSLARAQLQRLVERELSAAQLRRLLDDAGDGSLLAALCARRLAGLARSSGSTSEAAAVLARTAEARRRHGLEAGDTAPGALRTVGLLVPLSGRFKAAGEQLLAGALEGAAPGEADGLRVVIRDSARDPAAAARQLLEQEGAVALAGTLDPRVAGVVAAEAAGHGVPFVATAPGAAEAKLDSTSLRLFHPNRARAVALTRYAVKTGKARRLVILAPASRFGKAMASAAREAAAASGARLVASLTYPPGAHSFTAQAKKLKKLQFDALLAPDSARAVALLAPALAREGLWASGRSISRGKEQRRRYLLLATADGLSPRELTTSARYLEGAVLAPGFFPDTAASGSGPVAALMGQSLGRPPTLLEAYARDSLALLRQALAGGASDGASLMRTLRGSAGAAGLTGPLAFDKKGRRSSPPNLYTVTGGQVRLLSD